MTPLLWVISALAGTCPEYGAARVVLDLGADGPSEASGVATSRTRPGVFFTHDDGGAPEVVAFDLDGGLIEAHAVNGAAVVDWEDIAAGPCPGGGDCLFIGDIGDNDGTRTWISVYVAEEPGPQETIEVLEEWRVQWPEGPQDAETVLVHPQTGRVSVLSKDPSGLTDVGEFPASPGAGIATLEIVATFVLLESDEGDRLVAGGAWDMEGERVALRARERLLEWRTDPCDPHGHWENTPQSWSTPSMSRAEGVDYTLDGGLVLVAEGSPAEVGLVSCPDHEAGTGECVEQEDCGCGSGGSAWLVLPVLGFSRRRGRLRPR